MDKGPTISLLRGVRGSFLVSNNFFFEELAGQDNFFPISVLCRMFFSLLNYLQDFFCSKMVSPSFCKLFLKIYIVAI